MVFTLRHSRHVGGRKQKISNELLLFVHQQLYIAALLSVSLEIGCKPPIIVFIKYYLNVEVTEEAQRKYDRNLVIGSLNRNKIILLQHLWKLINISFISHAQLRAFLNIFPLVKSMIQKSLEYYRGPYTPPYLNKITHWKLIASVWAEKMEGPLNFLFTPTKTK